MARHRTFASKNYKQMRMFIIVFALITCSVKGTWAQGFIETDYLTRSEMSDNGGAKHGNGDMLRVKGRCTLPLSVKVNEGSQPTMWSATLAASYATMNNEGEALTINPDEIVNASLNISHVRPLSSHWQLIASLGAGVYAQPSEVAWRSILANGAAIFAYKFSDNLSAGFGVGLTNSYGVPMIMPMGYLSWRTGGNVRVQVDMASGMSVKVSTALGKRFTLELTAIEIDGMSAVRRIDGKSKIYSTMMMRSTLSPSLNLSKKLKLRFGIGGTWLRSVRLTDRNLKGFVNSFGDDDGKYRFRPSLRLSAGVSYGL